MAIDRRRFVELTAFGGTAWIAGGGAAPHGAAAAPAKPARAGAVTLRMTLWGSFLYVFTTRHGGDRRRLEAASLDAGAVPGCTTVRHHPTFEVKTGEIDSASTVVPGPKGHLPEGVYTLQVDPGARPLDTPGLGDAPADCPSDDELHSLRHLPRLVTRQNSLYRGWRSRFGTRIVFPGGKLRARRPHHIKGGAIPRWYVQGPGRRTGPFAFTDTLELSVELPDGRAVFSKAEGGLLVVRPVGDSALIEVELSSHPLGPDAGLPEKGKPEQHMCGLYAAFSKPPAQKDRSTLIFEDWCGKPPDRHPSKVCTGGWIEEPENYP